MEFPFPERIETILAQLKWMEEGKKKAVFIPYYCPYLKVLDGYSSVETKRGLFIYNPNKITESEILEAVNSDSIGLILGYGTARKPVKPTGSITVRGADGLEKQSVLTDKECFSSVWNASQYLAGKGDFVCIEDTIQASYERVCYWKNMLELEINSQKEYAH